MRSLETLKKSLSLLKSADSYETHNYESPKGVSAERHRFSQKYVTSPSGRSIHTVSVHHLGDPLLQTNISHSRAMKKEHGKQQAQGNKFVVTRDFEQLSSSRKGSFKKRKFYGFQHISYHSGVESASKAYHSQMDEVGMKKRKVAFMDN